MHDDTPAEMIFALVLLLCPCSVAAQHTPAADGLAGRARRNLRSLQDVSEETAALEDDEVPFVDFFADQSMSMLVQPLVDDEVEQKIYYGTGRCGCGLRTLSNH